MFRAAVAIVYFLRNILNNANYTIKTDFDDCFIEDTNQDTYDVRFKMSYDKTTSTIKAPFVALQDNGTLTYFDFEIVYNFENETLTQFTLSGYAGPKASVTNDGVECFRFKNNSLSRLSHTATVFNQFATEKIAEMNSILEPAKEANPENYSTEYNQAMQDAMGA